MEQPKVSVVMTVYNGEKYLRSAVWSVLQQTYKNFELIVIVEAGTTDNTVDILKKFKDSRLRIFINETKLGISESLNRGLKLAQGKYIARLDADDICCPRRLEKQIKVLERFPNIGMCGTNVYMIDQNDRIIDVSNHAYKPDALKMLLYTANYFTSSSVMMRSKILDAYHLQYSGNVSEDYLLWTQIAEKSVVCNLPEYLVGYRISEQNRTRRLLKLQESKDLEIHRALWENAGIEYKLNHSFSYRIGSRKAALVREQMLEELWCSKFKYMNFESFYDVMLRFYKLVGLNEREAFLKYLRLTSNLFGLHDKRKCYFYYFKQTLHYQKWMMTRKIKRGKRLGTNR